jgi:hypothetical protein
VGREGFAAASSDNRNRVGELDGVWSVRRLGGLLPPLVGMRKRIHGGAGETAIGPMPGVPFDVVGLSLRYHSPFKGFVDELEPAKSGYVGRATFRGRAFGRFALERVPDEGGSEWRRKSSRTS